MKLSISILSLLFNCMVLSQLPENDERREFSGPVKSITYLITQYSDSKVTSSNLQLFLFNDQGFLTSSMEKTDQGFEDGCTLTYDKTGKVLLSEQWQFSGELAQRMEFLYDTSGYVVRKNEFSYGTFYGYEKLCYNERGFLSKRVVDYGSGTTVFSFEYDDYNKVIQEVMTRAGTEVLRTFKYNDLGKLQSETSKVLKSDETFSPPEYSGLDLPESEIKLGDSRNYTTTYTYDISGRLIHLVTISDSSFDEDEFTYSYNDQGDISEQLYLSPYDKKHYDWKITYVYDDHGNWTECKRMLSEGHYSVEKRQITYY